MLASSASRNRSISWSVAPGPPAMSPVSNKQPCLLQILLAMRTIRDPFDEGPKLLHQMAGVGEITGAGARDLDASLLLQHEQRLAHGRPADQRAISSFSEDGSRLELVGDDHRLSFSATSWARLRRPTGNSPSGAREVTHHATARFARHAVSARGQQRVVNPITPPLSPRSRRALPARIVPTIRGPRAKVSIDSV